MKRLVIALICLILLAGCVNDDSTDVIGGTDMYISGKFGVQYEKKPMRMMNLDGELYFDSGLVSDMSPRCGTLDGNLTKTAFENEIPKGDGESNFDADGYQSASAITKEVPIDGNWVIFKKFSGLYGVTTNLTDFKYCFYIKGRLNNAAIDSELVVLTNDEDITFSDVFEPMLSSLYIPEQERKEFVYDYVVPGDKWGVYLTPYDVTPQGMTVCIEQFGGNATGELQTGSWYELQYTTGEGWTPLEPIIDNGTWTALAYGIKNNDVTGLDINWQSLYGELPSGDYRLAKKIVDFRAAGDYDEKLYYVYFSIEG